MQYKKRTTHNNKTRQMTLPYHFQEPLLMLNAQLNGLMVHLETESDQGLFVVVSRETESPLSSSLGSSSSRTLSRCQARLRYKSLLPPEAFPGKKPAFSERLSRPLLALVRQYHVDRNPNLSSHAARRHPNTTCKKGPGTLNSLDSFYQKLGQTDVFSKEFSGQIEPIKVLQPPVDDAAYLSMSDLDLKILAQAECFVTYQLVPWIEAAPTENPFELSEHEAHLISQALDIRLY